MLDLTHRLYILRSNLPLEVAGMLPKWLVYWATIRLWAHSTKVHSDRTPDRVNIWEALEAWQK